MKTLLVASAAFLSLAASAIAAPPPASAFGRIPATVDASISPDGKRIAILGGAASQRFVSIATIDDPNLPMLSLGDVEGISLRWAGDSHVIARVAYWEKSGPRVAYRLERNIAINTQAKAVSRLLDGDAVSQLLIEQPILGVVNGPPSRVIVKGLSLAQANAGMDTRIKRKGEGGLIVSLWSVDPTTGRGVLIERGNHDTNSWQVDRAGTPRVRIDVDEITANVSVLTRTGPQAWSKVWTSGFSGRDGYHGYSEPDNAIYLEIGGKLVRRPLDGGADVPLVIADGGSSPSLVWDMHRNTVVGVNAGGEQRQTIYTDAELGAVHAGLAKAFKGKIVHVAEWSADRTRFIVNVSGPATPTVWYLYDKARKELSPIGETYPELAGVAFGRTTWITYKARDGLEIPAYLTLPPGASTTKPPLVVLPHGGPRARDSGDFDFIVQFLASRGYAVLQPQFRGSWGFGDAFAKAGEGEWGGKMQTDLLDGVSAVKAMGVVSAGQPCIVGASFGGYAALAGATLHPDAYRCAASIAGVSDLGLLLLEEGRIYGYDSASLGELRKELGAATKDKLEATSPARHASAVIAPILLIHGEEDTVVMPEQSQKMADALKAAGKPYEYVVLARENHYLTRTATRTQTLEALETFLAKNLTVN